MPSLPEIFSAGLSKVSGAFNRVSSMVQSQQSVPVITEDSIEPRGSIPEHIRGRVSGWGQPPNLSTVITDISKIQAALRIAERGDTYQLFTLYRDLTLSSSHIQAELGKRKMVVCGQPYSIQPMDKKNAQDVAACEAVKQMIEDCENWDLAMAGLMDATIWPVSVVEKIFEPYQKKPGSTISLRFSLKRLVPVQPVLMCYKLPYMAQGGFQAPGTNGAIAPNEIPLNGVQRSGKDPFDTIWNPDTWEPNLRFYSVFPNGYPNFSWANIYAPDPMRHVVHRGTLLGGIPDNFGAAMRSIMFWWFFGVQNRDWWARAGERFGSPFIVVKANTQDKSKMDFYQTALQLATKVFGLVVDTNAEVQLEKASSVDFATGYKILHDTCNDEISKLIVGQTTSSNQKSGGGLGDGTAQVHEQVRQDIRTYDQKVLGNTLKRQLFAQFMEINGIPGNPPNIVWGGLDEGAAAQHADRLVKLKNAGLKPTDDALEHISEKQGMNLEHAPEPEPAGMGKNGNRPKPGS